MPLVSTTINGWGGRIIAISESSAMMAKFFLFLLFSRFAAGDLEENISDDGGALLRRLGSISQKCIAVHFCLCCLLGLVFGPLLRRLPNIFPDERSHLLRTTISTYLACTGAVIGCFGVGLQGLARDSRLDVCFFGGILGFLRLLALFTLDLPHLVMSSYLLFARDAIHGCQGCASQGQLAHLLVIFLLVAGTVGLLMAAKAVMMDLPWFRFGSNYRRRREFLKKKAQYSSRWIFMQKQLWQATREVRIKAEQRRLADSQPSA
jgi:hypothetical protein